MATRRAAKRAKRKSTNPTVEQLRQQIRSIVPEPIRPTAPAPVEPDDEQVPAPVQRKPPRGGWGNLPDLDGYREIAEEHFATEGEEPQC